MNTRLQLLLPALLLVCFQDLRAQWCVQRSVLPTPETTGASSPSVFRLRNTLVTIPVVFHVVWRTEKDNITDEQIASQIQALNQAFRLQNANQDIITPAFRMLAADLEIEFCLARSDPEGVATNGITRTRTVIDRIASVLTPDGRRSICYSAAGGQDAWDSNRYLNIWIGEMSAGLAGEASFPGQDEAAEDGIRIAPDRVGTNRYGNSAL